MRQLFWLLGAVLGGGCSETASQTPVQTVSESVPERRESGFQRNGDRYTGRVTNPTSGVELAVVVDFPKGEGPWPLLVVVPGGTLSGERALPAQERVEWTETGFAVATWDPDGRGESGGEEDRGGHIHQDGLAAVIDEVSMLPDVDTERVGLVSLSYGVVMATGMLSRHVSPVLFLVDWEGPASRWDTMDCATDISRPGGPPKGAVSATSCEDEAYWSEREAVRFVSLLQIPYHRVQFQRDHKQPDTDHSTQMVEAAVSAGVAEVWHNEQRLRGAVDGLDWLANGPRTTAILRYATQRMEAASGEPVVSAQAPEHLIGAETGPPDRSKGGPAGRKGKNRR